MNEELNTESVQSCACERCTCTEPSDLTLGGVALCGCCAADCPDVHGEEAEERRAQFWREQRAEEHEIARIVNERQHEHPRPLSELAADLGLSLDRWAAADDSEGEGTSPNDHSAPFAWRYVVSRSNASTNPDAEPGGEAFEIRELYPLDDSKKPLYTVDPVAPMGATLDELREELLHMLAALDQPILDLTTDPPTLHP